MIKSREMTFSEFEIEELLKRHVLGEKLEYSEYCLLAANHYLRGNYSFPDFEEMEIMYTERYSDLSDRISAFRWQEQEFKKRTISLDKTDLVVETMVDDWDFGEKCGAAACQLEHELKLIKSMEEQVQLKFTTVLTKKQLLNILGILSENKCILESNIKAWLYWFGLGEKPELSTLKWQCNNQYLADTIDMLTIPGSSKKPIIQKAFNTPQFKTNTRRSTESGLQYQNIDSQNLYDLLIRKELL